MKTAITSKFNGVWPLIYMIMTLLCSAEIAFAVEYGAQWNSRKFIVSGVDEKAQKTALQKLDRCIDIIGKEFKILDGNPLRYDFENIGRIDKEIANEDPEYYRAIMTCLSLLDETQFGANSWKWSEIRDKDYYKRREKILHILLEKSFRTEERGIADIREKMSIYFDTQLLAVLTKLNTSEEGSEERRDLINAYSIMASYYQTVLYAWSRPIDESLLEDIINAFKLFHDIQHEPGKIDAKATKKILKRTNQIKKEIIKGLDRRGYDELLEVSKTSDSSKINEALTLQVKEACDSLSAINGSVPGSHPLDELPSPQNATDLITTVDPVITYAKDWAKTISKLVQQKDYKAASKLLQEGLRTNPHDGEAHYYLGYIEYVNKHYDDAIPHFLKAPKGYYNLYYYLGDSYYQLGQYGQAYAWLTQYDLNPEFKQAVQERYPTTLAQSNFLLSDIFLRTKNYPHAIEHARKGIAHDEKYAPNYTLLGLIYFELNRYQEAHDLFLKAYELNPTEFNAKHLKKSRSRL